VSPTTMPTSSTPPVDRVQVDRAVPLTGHPSRPLTSTELATARRMLTDLGCIPAEVTWRLGGAR
jgi:hypothetical protein